VEIRRQMIEVNARVDHLEWSDAEIEHHVARTMPDGAV
jgi:hypothetical protein